MAVQPPTLLQGVNALRELVVSVSCSVKTSGNKLPCLHPLSNRRDLQNKCFPDGGHHACGRDLWLARKNSFLFPGTPPSIEIPAGPYPFMVESDDGRQVPVVQAYAYGKYLGYLKVTFDPEGNVVSSTGNPILLNSSIPQGRIS